MQDVKILTPSPLVGKGASSRAHAKLRRLAVMENLVAPSPDCRLVPLTKGKFAIVDNEDYEHMSQFHWFLHGGGYAVTKSGSVLMHRMILKADHGQVCDHINRNRLDNRRCNLRLCNNTENSRHCIKKTLMAGRQTHSRFKGVSKNHKTKPWRAYIQFNGKYNHLGLYDSEIEAALAYNAAATKHFGEFALLNEIP